ncbi:MAG: GxxExxY protein [Planctomycetota bacterium]
MNEEDRLNKITESIIGVAIDIHRAFGSGLLESAYEACMTYDLIQAGMTVEQQKPLPVVYRGVKLECGYRLDLLIENEVIVETKSVEKLLPIHNAQLLSYLKLAGCKVGLLMNFNVEMLKDGIQRVVNHFPESSAVTNPKAKLPVERLSLKKSYSFTAENAEVAEMDQEERLNKITETIIGVAIYIHKALGSGLLESAYEACMVYDITQAGLSVEQQIPIPVKYREVKIECGYRLDLLVDKEVIVEIKSIETFLPIHKARLMSHLKLAGCKVGLLINFNVEILKDGIQRVVNNFPNSLRPPRPLR